MTEKKWYDSIYPEKDDALERGLNLLEDLRGALPAEKAGAIDEAKALLCRAAKIYREAQQRVEEDVRKE